MKKVVTVQVGADGVLTLSLPLGEAEANRMVRVSVETVEGPASSTPADMDREAWLQFIERSAGSITDPTFERQPQVEPTISIRTQEEWLRFIEATAGKWLGELDRPPQGEYEKRGE